MRRRRIRRAIPLDPSLKARAELVHEVTSQALATAEKGAVGWLTACGTITGLVTGAVLFQGPATVDAFADDGARVVSVLATIVGIALVFGALWTAAKAAHGIDARPAKEVADRHPNVQVWRLQLARGKAQLVERSRSYLLAGFVAILVPAGFAWALPPSTTTKVSLCADLSIADGSKVTIEDPRSLPASVTLDEVDELTITPCDDDR